MFIEVIPAIRMPRHLNYFSYQVPQNLEGQIKVGQIVQVNFHGRRASALIVKILPDKKPQRKLKSIEKILFAETLITQAQIQLIQQIADYYAVSRGIVCRSLLPTIPKRTTAKDFSLSKISERQGSKRKMAPELFWWQTLKQKNKKYLKIIKNHKNQQILILVPQIELIDKIASSLKLAEDQTIKIHNGLPKTKLFSNWLEILNGRPKIIIGTKISVLLPFNNLGAVIIDQEHDWDHKQSDINPRYDARRVAEWVSQWFGCSLLFSTPCPRVETYYLQKNKNLKTTKLLSAPSKEENKLSIIDLHQENLKGNYTFLSDSLIEKISLALANQQKIFLLHNRRGMAGLVTCLECGYVFKCPTCDIALVYYNQTKKMHCHHCGWAQDIPPLCPKCNGPELKFKGKGLEDIAGKITKIFPDKKIAVLYRQKKPNLQSVQNSQIIIGTQFALNKIDWTDIGLLAITNFSQLINQPDLRCQEKAYQLLKTLQTSAAQAKFVIQAYQPKNIILRSLSVGQPHLFYQSELKSRQELGYPPFCQLIKIIYQDPSNSRAYYLSDKLIKKLKKEKDGRIEILGPLPAYPRVIRGKYKYHVILKIKPNLPPNRLSYIFQQIPADFIIDVDPEKLS